MKAKTKKTVTKAEKKEIKHDIVKDWDIVAHVVKVTPNCFDWFGEAYVTESLFINKYGSCIGCICVCIGNGTIRVMDPTLYQEFIVCEKGW
jgi:hypothetical protein